MSFGTAASSASLHATRPILSSRVNLSLLLRIKNSLIDTSRAFHYLVDLRPTDRWAVPKGAIKHIFLRFAGSKFFRDFIAEAHYLERNLFCCFFLNHFVIHLFYFKCDSGEDSTRQARNLPHEPLREPTSAPLKLSKEGHADGLGFCVLCFLWFRCVLHPACPASEQSLGLRRFAWGL